MAAYYARCAHCGDSVNLAHALRLSDGRRAHPDCLARHAVGMVASTALDSIESPDLIGCSAETMERDQVHAGMSPQQEPAA